MKFRKIQWDYIPLIRKISSNLKETRILISIRDTLLPKLISGELKILDAGNLIEERESILDNWRAIELQSIEWFRELGYQYKDGEIMKFWMKTKTTIDTYE